MRRDHLHTVGKPCLLEQLRSYAGRSLKIVYIPAFPRDRAAGRENASVSMRIELLYRNLDRITINPSFNHQDVNINAVRHCQERINPEECNDRNGDEKTKQ